MQSTLQTATHKLMTKVVLNVRIISPTSRLIVENNRLIFFKLIKNLILNRDRLKLDRNVQV